MKLKPAYVYLAVGVALILGWFYWYEYRPTQARSECSDWAVNAAINFHREKYNIEGEGAGTYEIGVRNQYFRECLDKKGIAN